MNGRFEIAILLYLTGNQLNLFTLLLQLKMHYGYDAYMLQETYDILEKMFTKDSISELPVLEQSFCHHSKMKFQVCFKYVQCLSKKLVFLPLYEIK